MCSVYLSGCLSVRPPACLSICLSVCRCTHTSSLHVSSLAASYSALQPLEVKAQRNMHRAAGHVDNVPSDLRFKPPQAIGGH